MIFNLDVIVFPRRCTTVRDGLKNPEAERLVKEIVRLERELKNIQDNCSHPNMETSETSVCDLHEHFCPDCGFSITA